MTTADLLGKILQVVMGLAIFAAVVGLLIFFIDRAPKKGRDYWQLAGFLLPALLFISIGLIYLAIRTSILAFQDNSGAFSLDNFVWMFTQPTAIRTSSTPSSGCCWSRRSPPRSASRTRSSSTARAGSASQGRSCSCRSRSRSSARA